MKYKFKFYINNDLGSDATNCYLLAWDMNENFYNCTIADGFLQVEKREPNTKPSKPFMAFRGLDGSRSILQAICEGLKDTGIIAEVDNAQRITSEAVAKERKDEIEYLRKSNDDLVKMLVNKL